MTDKPLHVRGAGLDRSAVNLGRASEALLSLHGLGGGTSSDVYAASGLPLGALGLVGEAARLRYNHGFDDYRARLIRGARSASNMSKVVTTNKDGYAQAEHAGVRAMLTLRDTRDSSPTTVCSRTTAIPSPPPIPCSSRPGTPRPGRRTRCSPARAPARWEPSTWTAGWPRATTSGATATTTASAPPTAR